MAVRPPRAFSLGELMIVIAILGVLIALAVPSWVREAESEPVGGAALELRRLANDAGAPAADPLSDLHCTP